VEATAAKSPSLGTGFAQAVEICSSSETPLAGGVGLPRPHRVKTAIGELAA